MDTDDYVIDVTGLRRAYSGGFEAVRGITFSVARGELFALLGTNGAGKTSTVELLEGLARPSGGQVRVLGRDPYEERDVVRPRTGVGCTPSGSRSRWARCCVGRTRRVSLNGLDARVASLEEAFLAIAGDAARGLRWTRR